MSSSRIRISGALLLLVGGGVLAAVSFVPSKPGAAKNHGPMLAVSRLNAGARSNAVNQDGPLFIAAPDTTAVVPNAPTFGHPVISGIGGTGFEESIRIDPNLNANGE